MLDDLQVFTEGTDALMMITVDHHVRTKEGMEKRAGKVIGGMVNILVWILVQISV